MSETSTLTGPLIKMLRDAGILTFRMQSGVIPKGNRYIYLCEKGTADILCFHRDRVFWLETKDPKGSTQKQREDDQFKFQQRVEELGHYYLRITQIPESVEEALR